MTTNVLTQEFVFTLLDDQLDGKEFTIDFNEVWQRAGFTLYQNAVRAVKSYLIENEDYIIDPSLRMELTTMQGLSVQEKGALLSKKPIKLSPDGFDHLMMQAQTDEGREARKLFIMYKKQYMANLKAQLLQSPSAKAKTNLKILKDAVIKQKRYILAMERIIREDNGDRMNFVEVTQNVLRFLAFERPEVLEFHLNDRRQTTEIELMFIGAEFGYFEYAKNFLKQEDVENSQAYMLYTEIKQGMKQLGGKVHIRQFLHLLSDTDPILKVPAKTKTKKAKK